MGLCKWEMVLGENTVTFKCQDREEIEHRFRLAFRIGSYITHEFDLIVLDCGLVFFPLRLRIPHVPHVFSQGSGKTM